MREIKFRVFESVNSGMHHVDLAFMTKDGNFILPIGSQDLTGKYTRMNLDAVKVMQYTGLKDKNGKEIYEGDVLKLLNNKREIVNFSNGAFCWNGLPLCIAENGEEVHASEYTEIIGNIYENPDLLEERR